MIEAAYIYSFLGTFTCFLERVPRFPPACGNAYISRKRKFNSAVLGTAPANAGDCIRAYNFLNRGLARSRLRNESAERVSQYRAAL